MRSACGDDEPQRHRDAETPVFENKDFSVSLSLCGTGFCQWTSRRMKSEGLSERDMQDRAPLEDAGHELAPREVEPELDADGTNRRLVMHAEAGGGPEVHQAHVARA